MNRGNLGVTLVGFLVAGVILASLAVVGAGEVLTAIEKRIRDFVGDFPQETRRGPSVSLDTRYLRYEHVIEKIDDGFREILTVRE